MCFERRLWQKTYMHALAHMHATMSGMHNAARYQLDSNLQSKSWQGGGGGGRGAAQAKLHTRGDLTCRVNVGDARAVDALQGVLQLGGSAQGVEQVDDGGGDLADGFVVGRDGVDDLVQPGTDDAGMVALGVSNLGSRLAVGRGGEEANGSQVGGSTQVLQPGQILGLLTCSTLSALPMQLQQSLKKVAQHN